MRVVITGGTGLIGRALSRSLLADGHEVVVLSRSADDARVEPGAVLWVWNGRDLGPWAATLDGADAVVNLAGASLAGDGAIPQRWTSRYKAVIRDSRLDAGAALLAALRTCERVPEVLIQASGVGVYGSWPDDHEHCSERCAPGEDYLARLAVDWEASTEACVDLGVRRVVIRTGVVLDGVGGALPRIAMPFRFGVGGPLGSGTQMLSWIHLDDEVRAIRFLLENREMRGDFNLAAPHACSNAEFGRALGRALHRPYWMPTPDFAMRVLLGEAADLVLRGQHAVPVRLLEAGFRFRYPEVDAALGDLLAR